MDQAVLFFGERGGTGEARQARLAQSGPTLVPKAPAARCADVRAPRADGFVRGVLDSYALTFFLIC